VFPAGHGKEYLWDRLFHVDGDRAGCARFANQLLTTVAWKIGGQIEYALEGSVFIAGAAVQWLRDGLGIIRTSAGHRGAGSHGAGQWRGLFRAGVLGAGIAPLGPVRTGAILGLTRGTTAAHLARATLEAVAFQSADLLHAMERDSGLPLPELRVDGGAAVNDFLMQFQADLLQVPWSGHAPSRRPRWGRVPRGARHWILEEPGGDRRSLGGGPALRAGTARFGNAGFARPLAPGGRAFQGMGEALNSRDASLLALDQSPGPWTCVS